MPDVSHMLEGIFNTRKREKSFVATFYWHILSSKKEYILNLTLRYEIANEI
jgi:hypothetical protein